MKIIRKDYYAYGSHIFAMNLISMIIIAKMGEKLFAKTITTLIKGSKRVGENKEVHIRVSKSRLVRLMKELDGRN